MTERRVPAAAATTRTATTVTVPGRPQRSEQRRGSRGMATLEWLLIIAAAGGFAAAMTAGLDRLTADHTAQTPPSSSDDARPRIAAARINDRALAATTAGRDAPDNNSPDPRDTLIAALDGLRSECELLPRAFPDAVTAAHWAWLPDQTDSPDAEGRWLCRLDGPSQ